MERFATRRRGLLSIAPFDDPETVLANSARLFGKRHPGRIRPTAVGAANTIP